MSDFATYADSYEHFALKRQDGILEVTFHTNDGPMIWTAKVRSEFPRVMADIATDFENLVVIMTGAGNAFMSNFIPFEPPSDSAPQEQKYSRPGIPLESRSPTDFYEGERLLRTLLDIEVPVIAAINGPVELHAPIPLLSDVVLAAETASFRDSIHIPNGVVPGDGVHVVWPELIGLNRARYFLLTDQTLSAEEAHQLGLVNEILPHDQLLSRAWEIASELARLPVMTLRYTRVLLTQGIRRRLSDELQLGLAFERLAMTAGRGHRLDR
jgi:enoyl-CoA hydratase/carnithine racemase